jgi:urate oxidase
MQRFASGSKKAYYGKGDVIAYRLKRRGETGFFGANVKILIYGKAFWPTYTTGDNSGLIATDSMKNFVQRETMNFAGDDLESYCRFLVEKFLDTYPQAEGAQVTAGEIPYNRLSESGVSFAPGGPDRAWARIEKTRSGLAELTSGIEGFRLLRLNGSAFAGFVRDAYTTLPDILNRPLHMWLDLDWSYVSAANGFTRGEITAAVRAIVHRVFDGFTSGSIQQIIYRIGTELLSGIPDIAEVNLEANNRTWDTIAESGDELGVYTDARPPYGCLALSLSRE